MRKIWIALTLVGVTAFALMTANVRKGVARGNENIDSRAQIGLKLAPLPLNLRGKDVELVGYGSYLVNTIGDCNGCHTVQEFLPGHDPFKGQPKKIDPKTYLRGGRAFGPFVTPNLLPTIGTGLPAGATLSQFVQGLRHGTDFDDPGKLQQVSPWPSYQNMTDLDFRAMYEYLSALPAVNAAD